MRKTIVKLNFEKMFEISKYIFVAGTSFFVDLFLFTIFNNLLNNFTGKYSIILSTIIARILSSLYNYILNSRFVFKKFDCLAIYKYYLLVVCQMLISSFSVYIISNILIKINDTIIKFFIDIIIFIINYFIQKKYIFR